MAQATTVQASCKSVTIDGVTVSIIDGVPRARDIDLASAMGFKHPLDIRKLIKRHENSLGKVFATVAKTSERGGRPGSECWLTEEQALFVAAKSDTDRAVEILQMVIRVFVSVRRGETATVTKTIGTSPFAEFTKGDPAIMRAVTFELFGDRYDARVLRAVRRLDPNPSLSMSWWVGRLDEFQGMLAAPASLATVGGVQ